MSDHYKEAKTMKQQPKENLMLLNVFSIFSLNIEARTKNLCKNVILFAF